MEKDAFDEELDEEEEEDDDSASDDTGGACCCSFGMLCIVVICSMCLLGFRCYLDHVQTMEKLRIEQSGKSEK